MIMQTEQWREVDGYNGFYKVSNYGAVISEDRYVKCGYKGKGLKLLKGRLMRPYLGRDGYLYYLLTVNKKSQHVALHRLIAIHFIDNPYNKREVNHIDSNRLNNNIENLEWVTPSENIYHAIHHGNKKQIGEDNWMAKLKKEQVLIIRSSTDKNSDLAKQYNVSRRTISFIKNNQRWVNI